MGKLGLPRDVQVRLRSRLDQIPRYFRSVFDWLGFVYGYINFDLLSLILFMHTFIILTCYC